EAASVFETGLTVAGSQAGGVVAGSQVTLDPFAAGGRLPAETAGTGSRVAARPDARTGTTRPGTTRPWGEEAGRLPVVRTRDESRGTQGGKRSDDATPAENG